MMRRNEISAIGIVDKNGHLSMYMDEINEFFRGNKGARVVATFHVAPTASSEAMRAYYFNYIVPTITRAAYEQGERMTQEGVEENLRMLSPVCWETKVDIDSGEYSSRLKKIPELSNSELTEHIDFVKQYAAENYYVYVEEPTTL